MGTDLMTLGILWTGLYNRACRITDEDGRRKFCGLLEDQLMKMIKIADSEETRDLKLAQYISIGKDILDIQQQMGLPSKSSPQA
jgi:hypothetical protein